MSEKKPEPKAAGKDDPKPMPKAAVKKAKQFVGADFVYVVLAEIEIDGTAYVLTCPDPGKHNIERPGVVLMPAPAPESYLED